MNKIELRERRFVHAVRTALNETAGQLQPDVRDRLAAARRTALAHKKAEVPSTVHSPALAMPGVGSMSFETEGETPSANAIHIRDEGEAGGVEHVLERTVAIAQYWPRTIVGEPLQRGNTPADRRT